MFHPGGKDLLRMETGCADNHAVEVVIVSSKSLCQAIAAEGTPLAGGTVLVRNALGFIVPYDSHREDAGRIEDLLRHVRAEAAYDFAPGLFFPGPCVLMSLHD